MNPVGHGLHFVDVQTQAIQRLHLIELHAASRSARQLQAPDRCAFAALAAQLPLPLSSGARHLWRASPAICHGRKVLSVPVRHGPCIGRGQEPVALSQRDRLLARRRRGGGASRTRMQPPRILGGVVPARLRVPNQRPVLIRPPHRHHDELLAAPLGVARVHFSHRAVHNYRRVILRLPLLRAGLGQVGHECRLSHAPEPHLHGARGAAGCRPPARCCPTPRGRDRRLTAEPSGCGARSGGSPCSAGRARSCLGRAASRHGGWVDVLVLRRPHPLLEKPGESGGLLLAERPVLLRGRIGAHRP